MAKILVSLFLLLVVATSGAARAQRPEVALVNLVSGDVSYAPRAGTPGKVLPFMKVRDGDRINVAAGARLRIVFYESAQQELWLGPASFRARTGAAEPISGKAAEISQLAVDVADRMARIPELIRTAKLGGGQLRGGLTRQQQASLEQQAALAQARAIYERMRLDMPADDITPELILYTALFEFLVFDEMKVVIQEMRRKQPDNQDVRALDAWLTSQMPR